MKFVAFFIFAFSHSYAATQAYDLDLQYSINGEILSTPKIVVYESERGAIFITKNNKEHFIEVVAQNEKTNKAIEVQFAVGHLAADGTKVISGQPTIIVKENEKASVSVHDKNGKEEYSVQVIAKKKFLSL